LYRILSNILPVDKLAGLLAWAAVAGFDVVLAELLVVEVWLSPAVGAKQTACLRQSLSILRAKDSQQRFWRLMPAQTFLMPAEIYFLHI
jgi:hypothetical protein